MNTEKDTPEESRPGTCPSDFEVGDRFWFVDKTGSTNLGTVLTSKPDEVSVVWDDGTEYTFAADPKKPLAPFLKNCGKALDLTQLKVGSRLSMFSGTERVYWEVVGYIPGKEVELVILGKDRPPFKRVASEKHSLEKLMSIWELEG